MKRFLSVALVLVCACGALGQSSSFGTVVTTLLARFKDSTVDLSWKLPVAQATPSSSLVPYLSTGYKYVVVPHDGDSGFEQPGFDDSSFSVGNAPFASGGGCPLDSYIQTNWPINTDILLRRHFTVNGTIHSATVSAAIDNDLQVFINGVDISGGLVSHEDCATRGSVIFNASDSLFKNGDNLLAVRARDRGAESYVDVQLAGIVTQAVTSPSVASYNIYRSTDGLNFSLIQSGSPATNYEDTGLTNGKTYYYKVRWVDPSGKESADSIVVSATPTSQASRSAGMTPPTILTAPPTQATIGSNYVYAPKASDPDPGDQLTYSLNSSPAGMTINSATGRIAWTPALSQSGYNPMTLTVTDKAGHFATESYFIVTAPPASPESLSLPTTSVTLGQPYLYQPQIQDENPGATLTYKLSASPAGMTINAQSGQIQWTPQASQTGQQNVVLTVTDQFGASFQQTWTIFVATLLPPAITSNPPTSASVSVPYSYQVTVSNSNAGALAFSLPIAPAGVSINAVTGLIQWIPTTSQTGTKNVKVSVVDQLGRSAVQSFAVQVYPALKPPTITLTSPSPNTTLTQVTDVVGTITDPNGSVGGPLTWALQILKPGTTVYQTIASGTGPVLKAVLGRIDPTLLPNNAYAVRVTATKGPFTATANVSYNVAGNFKLGNFSVQFTDLSIPVAGIPLTITRRYDSLDTSIGDFGAGWRLALPGQVADSSGGQAYTASTRVYVTRPDGKRVGFTFNPTYSGLFLPVYYPAFTPDAGVTDTLTTPSDQLFYSGGGFYNLSGPYQPTLFALTTKEGLAYNIDEVAGLQKITDLNGNTVTVTPAGLISSTGVSIGFQRDSQNRITQITEPGVGPGTLSYSYGSVSNLAAFTDQNGNATTYSYQNATFPNYLTGITDPLGRQTIRTVYNAAGQVIAQCDANGNPTTLAGCAKFSPDEAANLQTIVNARGYRTDLLLDGEGNVLTERHWLDNVNYLDTVRTYDRNDNLLTEVDPAGSKAVFTYDSASNLLSYQDPSGRTTAYTYNSCNEVEIEKDPNLSLTSYVYDQACNLTQVTDALGRKSLFAYDSVGQPLSVVDALNNKWVLTYDSSGFATSLTDPFGKTTTFTYGPLGELLSQTDRLNRRIDFSRDALHRLVKETWGDGRVTNYAYDSAGELFKAYDPDSSLAISYDSTGKAVSIDNSDTPGVPQITLFYAYDSDGNRTYVQDSLGAKTSYAYDSQDRLATIMQSGLGLHPKRIDMTYNSAGALLQVKRFSDLAGSLNVANTTFTYVCPSCVNLITGIHHHRADGSSINDLNFTLGPAGNITTITDAEGLHTYSSDAARTYCPQFTRAAFKRAKHTASI